MKLLVPIIQVGLNNKMMHLKNRIAGLCLLLVTALVLFSGDLRAQSAVCAQNLDRAQAMFDIGDLPGIPALLTPCIDNGGFSKDESIRAHQLITEVYLYLDDQPNADIWMIKLLKVDPEHKLDPTLDPQEIILHKEKFRYDPIFRVSAAFGVNRSAYRLITWYGVGNASDRTAYTPGYAINFSGKIEKEVYPGIDIGLGLGYVSKTFSAEEVVLWDAVPSGIDPTSVEGEDYGLGNIATYTENQNWLEVPVFAKYTYYGDGNRTFNPYGFLGLDFGLLLNASQSSTSRANGAEREGAGSSSNLPDPNLVDDNRRKLFNYYSFAGLGAKFRAKTHFFFVEVRYNYGMTNIVDGKGRYPLEVTTGGNKQESVFNIGVVDNDFTLDGFMAMIGFQLSIYNPQKLKEKQLK